MRLDPIAAFAGLRTLAALSVLAFGILQASAHASEGLEFLDPSDLDRWVEEGIIEEDERDQLLDWIDDPIDINAASADELALLPHIDETLSDAIQEARNAQPFRSIADLSRVPGLQPRIDAILPFIALQTFQTSGSLRQRLSDTRHDGSPAQLYGRIRLRPTASALIGLAQTAGGSPRLAWTPDGVLKPLESARIARGYAAWNGEGAVEQLLIGDYSVGTGVGLLLNSSRARYPNGTRPNDGSTTRERGAAASFRLGRWKALGFASKNNRRASLPADITGLSSSRAIENALSSELVGARASAETGAWRFGATAMAQRLRSRASIELEQPAPVGVAADFDGSVGGTRWRGEAAYADAPAGWTELLARSKTASARIAVYSLPPNFNSPRGARSDRRGILARAAVAPAPRWRAGFQLNGEKQLSTAVSSQRARGWIAAPIGRIITVGVSGRWNDDDLLRDNEIEWQTAEWTAATLDRWKISARWTQRNDQPYALLTRLDWKPVSRLQCGARVETESGNFSLKTLSAYISAWSSRSWRCRASFLRRWYRSASPSNRGQLTFNARWGYS